KLFLLLGRHALVVFFHTLFARFDFFKISGFFLVAHALHFLLVLGAHFFTDFLLALFQGFFLLRRHGIKLGFQLRLGGGALFFGHFFPVGALFLEIGLALFGAHVLDFIEIFGGHHAA